MPPTRSPLTLSLAPGMQEFLRYAVASGLALALDTFVFTASLRLGASLAVAAASGFMLGLALVYVLSTRLVFAHHRLADRRLEFTVFALVGIAGLLLTETLLWLLVGQLHMAPVAAKLACAGATFICNFLLRKSLLFTLRAPAPVPAR